MDMIFHNRKKEDFKVNVKDDVLEVAYEAKEETTCSSHLFI